MELKADLHITEAAFISACVEKESWALKKVYEDHYSIMYPVCLRYANNESDALDILHDGFIKVFRHIGSYKPGTSMKSWIKRIMVNTSIDYYRRETRRRTSDIEDARNVSSDNVDVLSKMTSDEILSCLQQLTPAYRSVFNLYVIEGYSHKEVAKRLDITESTSRSNLVKARSKLKELLLKKQQDLEYRVRK